MNIVSSRLFVRSHPHGMPEADIPSRLMFSSDFASRAFDVHAPASGLIHSRATDGGKPPAGAPLSAEVRRPESTKATTQKRFPASHSFPAYRHARRTR